MAKKKKIRKIKKGGKSGSKPLKATKREYDPTKLEQLPVTYQEVDDFFKGFKHPNLFPLRKETFLRIEKVTGRPLICYAAKTRNLPPGAQSPIDHGDVIGFGDLAFSTSEKEVDVLIISNGGSAEATERIVDLLRESFNRVRFIVPANAYSAATLLCFSGDEIIMDLPGTLGPIDPQINGVPAHAIRKAFETVKDLLKEEGPKALTAYMPLIMKYDLHIFEICRSAEELSKELARTWLSTLMLKCSESEPKVNKIVEHFSNYDIHNSHERSINRAKARQLGLKIVYVEEIQDLEGLVRGLCNQYEYWFDKTEFIKVFENSRGINWGRMQKLVPVVTPADMPLAEPQPSPPEQTE